MTVLFYTSMAFLAVAVILFIGIVIERFLGKETSKLRERIATISLVLYLVTFFTWIFLR